MKRRRDQLTKAILLAIILVVIAYLLLLWVGQVKNLSQSEKEMALITLWKNYQTKNLDPISFRTVDDSRESVSTSEGQSYTMLRAVWMNDQPNFDRSWNWTRDNLRQPNGLFAWLYGQRPDGSYGILHHRSGENSASDADVDIALALILASRRWNDDRYLQAAHEIIAAIWKEEVVLIKGRPYLAANNVERRSVDYIILNPSYLAPYAYRIFANLDQEHDWQALVDSSYTILTESLRSPLDQGRPGRLPPNWVVLNRATGQLTASPAANLDTNYGYDALRTPWRIALDWHWNREPRAKTWLKELDALEKSWRENQKLLAEYDHSGQAKVDYEAPAQYGTALAAFKITAPRAAQKIYLKKISPLYDRTAQTWKPLSYYDNNWLWFGLALYWDQLPNFY